VSPLSFNKVRILESTISRISSYSVGKIRHSESEKKVGRGCLAFKPAGNMNSASLKLTNEVVPVRWQWQFWPHVYKRTTSLPKRVILSDVEEKGIPTWASVTELKRA
jgi:hypothetical protein